MGEGDRQVKVYEVITTDLPLSEISAKAAQYPGAFLVKVGWSMGIVDREYVDTAACWCARCDNECRNAKLDADGDFASWFSRFMIVCPDCGNKRCPKATYHGNTCTKSNEPG